MKRIIAIAVGVLALVAGAVGMVNADPGPNDSNNHGLCTAYFNGQKNGNSDNAPPFAALEEEAREYTNGDNVDNDGDGQTDEADEDDGLSAEENIYNFCSNTSVIGGNTDHGRFTCTDDGDPVLPGEQTECENNPAPGKS